MFRFPRIFSLHQETKKDMRIPENEQEWPNSWSVVEYKEYSRMPFIQLPKANMLERSLGDVLTHRISGRDIDPEKSFTTQELSDIFYWSVGRNVVKSAPSDQRRFYPSGGGRYTTEIYMSFKGNDEIEAGVYHYNVRRHGLEKIGGKKHIEALLGLQGYKFALDAPLLLLLTSVFERSMRKYRERGYRFCLLEIGIIIESLYLVGAALKLQVCAVGAIREDATDSILDLDSRLETVINQFVLGHKKQKNG